MTSSLCRVEESDGPVLLHEDNTPPGLLESWADYHDYVLETYFGPEPPLPTNQDAMHP